MTLSKNHDLLNKKLTFQQINGRWFLCKRPVIDILMLLFISGSFTKYCQKCRKLETAKNNVHSPTVK